MDNTKIKLNNEKVEQLSGSTLNLSGHTIHNGDLTVKKGLIISSSGGTDYNLDFSDDGKLLRDGIELITGGTSSGGGHTIQENSSSLTQRTKLNIISNNSEDVVTDDSPNDATVYTPTIKSMNDFDGDNIDAGDIIQRNASNTKFELGQTEIFNNILESVVANVSANGDLGVILLADYSILGIRVEGDGVSTSGILHIGSNSSGATDIANIQLTASINSDLLIQKPYFSSINDTNLYISGITGGYVNLYFTFIKGVISKKILSGLKELSTAPIYYLDDTLKIIKYYYIENPVLYYEERYEYTGGVLSKLEIKDDLTNYWVQKTNIYNGSGLLDFPIITEITAWTIT